MLTTAVAVSCNHSHVLGSTISLRFFASSRKSGSFIVASNARQSCLTREAGVPGGTEKFRPIAASAARSFNIALSSSFFAKSKRRGVGCPYPFLILVAFSNPDCAIATIFFSFRSRRPAEIQLDQAPALPVTSPARVLC